MENRFKVWDKKLSVMWQEIELTKLLSYLIFQIMPNADAYLALKDHFRETIWLRGTGVKDQKGKEIYEGDIIKQRKEIAQIEYSDGAYELIASDGKFVTHLWTANPNEMEILGNIYQNPDLLVQPPVSDVK
jgi:hypothetical protein